jgi:hypothetical protein
MQHNGTVGKNFMAGFAKKDPGDNPDPDHQSDCYVNSYLNSTFRGYGTILVCLSK